MSSIDDLIRKIALAPVDNRTLARTPSYRKTTELLNALGSYLVGEPTPFDTVFSQIDDATLDSIKNELLGTMSIRSTALASNLAYKGQSLREVGSNLKSAFKNVNNELDALSGGGGALRLVREVSRELQNNRAGGRVAEELLTIFNRHGKKLWYRPQDEDYLAQFHGKGLFEHTSYAGEMDISGSGVAADPLESILHEIGHAVDEFVREKNLLPTEKLKAKFHPDYLKEVTGTGILHLDESFFNEAFNEAHLKPIRGVQQRTKSQAIKQLQDLGIIEGLQDSGEYYASSQEIVARNFALFELGKPLEFEELRPVIERLSRQVPQEFRDLIDDLKANIPKNIDYDTLINDVRENNPILRVQEVQSQPRRIGVKQRRVVTENQEGSGMFSTGELLGFENKHYPKVESKYVNGPAVQKFVDFYAKGDPLTANALEELIRNEADLIVTQGKYKHRGELPFTERGQLRVDAYRELLSEMGFSLGELSDEGIMELIKNPQPDASRVVRGRGEMNQKERLEKIAKDRIKELGLEDLDDPLVDLERELQASDRKGGKKLPLVDVLKQKFHRSVEEAEQLIETIRNAGMSPDEITMTSMKEVPGGYQARMKWGKFGLEPRTFYRQPGGGFSFNPPPPPPPPEDYYMPPEDEEPTGKSGKPILTDAQIKELYMQKYKERGGQIPVEEKAQQEFEGGLLGGVSTQLEEIKKTGRAINELTMDLTPAGEGVQKLTTAFKDGAEVVRRYNQYIVDTDAGLQAYSDDEYREYRRRKTPYTKTQLKALQEEGMYSNVFAAAQRKGFAPEQLNYIKTEESTGYQRVQFKKFDEDLGIDRRLNMTVTDTGRVMMDTSRRFQTLGGAITRNIGEVLKWGVAVSVIYGPLQKFQQLITDMITNQAKLVDITIALGSAQRSVSSIFDDAATIAQATGESITGVLDGYVLATRAAGGIADEQERVAVSNKLMADSLMLSKLSALNQAQALDILSAALRQVYAGLTKSEALSKGTELIDKWIATSRAANVDLATLATSFSIVSEQAENAGVSTDELNAMIAILSEKMGAMSPEETGNAMRAVVGGLYSDAAAKELSKYGVAVTDITGKQRDFLDISMELYNLYKTGIISEDQLNMISRAWGGGVRRQAVVSAFITDIGKIPQLVEAQQNSTGLGQEALAQQMETVQTALTQLGNSFMQLAQALGQEGGILGIVKGLVDMSTNAVTLISKVTAGLGTASPALYSTLAGMMYYGSAADKAKFRGRVGDAAGGAANWLYDNSALLQARGRYVERTRGLARGEYRSNMETGAFNFASKYGVATALTAFSAINSGMNGGGAEGVIGNLAGGIVGTLVAGGNPIGTAIGIAFGNVAAKVIKDAFEYEFDAKKLHFSLTVEEDKDKGAGKLTPEEQAAKEAQEASKTAFSNAMSISGTNNLRASIGAGLLNIGTWGQNAWRGITGQQQVEYNKLTPEDYVMALFQEKADAGMISEEVYNAVMGEIKNARNGPQFISKQNVETAPSVGRQQGYFNEYNKFIEMQGEGIRKNLFDRLSKGEISSKEYRDMLSEIPALSANVTSLYDAMTGGFESKGGVLSRTFNLPKGFSTPEQALSSYANTLINATPEQTMAVSQLIEELNYVGNAIDQAGGADKILIGDKWYTEAEAVDWYNNSLSVLKETFSNVAEEAVIATTKLPNFQEVSGYKPEYFKQTVAPAEMAYYNQYVKPQLSAQQQQVWQTMMTREADNRIFQGFGGQMFNLPEGQMLPPSPIEPWIRQQLINQGTITSGEATQLKTYPGYTVEQLKEKEAEANKMAQALYEQYGLQYPMEKFIAVADNGFLEMNTNLDLINIVLGQIKNIEEKQLDGMYNLPEGSNFYIPLSAAKMYPGGGGGGDMGGIYEQLKAMLANATLKTPVTQTISQVPQYQMPPLQGPPNPADYIWMPQLPTTGAQFTPAPGLSTTTPSALHPPAEFTEPLAGPTETQPWNWMWGTGKPGTYPVPPSEDILRGAPNTLAEAKPLSFKLDLNSTVSLVVDGRILATIIKPYLYEDMLRSEGGAGITKTFAV